MKDQLQLFNRGPAPGKTDTSREAAGIIAPHLGRLQQSVLRAIEISGTWGATNSELPGMTRLPYADTQPRTSELRDLGKIKDSGQRRKNDNGKNEIVWVKA